MSKWINPIERLPKPEEKVLIRFQRGDYTGVTTGMHEDGTVKEKDSSLWFMDLVMDYNEEDDSYYIPEGWWEDTEFNDIDEYNHPISCEVTGWMPLPEV